MAPKKAPRKSISPGKAKNSIQTAVKTQVETETEEEKAQREKEEKRKEYIRKHCTILEFKYADKSKKTVTCDRLMSWMDLQREICKNNPGKKMFMVQDKGLMVTADTFSPRPTLLVKEIFMAKFPSGNDLPVLNTKWDFLGYIGKPTLWVDPGEERQRKKEEALRKKMEEEKRREEEENAEEEAFRSKINANKNASSILSGI